MAQQVFELFATPLLRAEGVVSAEQAAALRGRLGDATTVANQRSDELSHSRILAPGEEPLLDEAAAQIAPHLVEFGTLLFGQRLAWSIKEMWVNVMQTGGRQAMHQHANCFVSGVLYLSECDASANTQFLRGIGGRGFVFGNANAASSTGPFNADRWIGPPPAVGDLVLFPSWLLHEVPVNRGGERITLAFNAIPDRLDNWGYSVSFSS